MVLKTAMTTGLMAVLAFGLYANDYVGYRDQYSDAKIRSIIEKVFKAVGDYSQVREAKTVYNEGRLIVGDSDLAGTFKEWIAFPACRRMDTCFEDMTVSRGQNGDGSWVIDYNGKRRVTDTKSSVRKDKFLAVLSILKRCLDAPDKQVVYYLDRKQVNQRTCHVLKIAGKKQSDMVHLSIDAENYLIRRAEVVSVKGQRNRLDFSDYRKQGRMRVPFVVESTFFPHGNSTKRIYSKRQLDPDLPKGVFDMPDDVRDFAFPNGQKSVSVPFILMNSLIYVPVVINGKEKLWMLDTGSSASIIHDNYAKELALKRKGRITALTVNRRIGATYVELPSFQVKGITFKKQTIASVELDGKYAKNEVGVLGYDFLSRFVTRIDYKGRSLTFYDPDGFKYEGTGTVIDARDRSGLLCVPMSIENKHRGEWLLDTGSSETMFFSDYDAVFSSRFDGKIVPHGFVVGTNGESIKIGRMLFKFLHIGNMRLDSPAIFVPLEKQAEVLHDKVIGHIGNSLLGRFVVYIDYRKPQIILEKAE